MLGQYHNKLCQITMTADVGKSHYISPHMDSPRLVNALCCFCFPECAACVNAGAPVAAKTLPTTPVAGKTLPAAAADAAAAGDKKSAAAGTAKAA